MAESNSILNIVLQLKDQASSQIDGFTGKLKDMQLEELDLCGALKSLSQSWKSFDDTFKSCIPKSNLNG